MRDSDIRTSRNSYTGPFSEGGETKLGCHTYAENGDTVDSDNLAGSSITPRPILPPRRDLKPEDYRRPISVSHSFTRPLSSLFGSNHSESNRGSVVGSIGTGSPNLYSPSTHSPYTPAMRQKVFNFVLNPSPPAVMTRKQSRDEVAMVRNAFKQNAYSRVIIHIHCIS